MNKAEMITKEIDVLAFHRGIFTSQASLLSPVAIPASNFQPMVGSLNSSSANQWMTYAGPAGIGLYSLKKKQPTGIVAKVQVHLRHPNREEMQRDFEEFSDQLTGPQVSTATQAEKEEYGKCPVFDLLGEDHYFIGPARIQKTVFLTRVFKGDLPSDISDLVAEVDQHAEKGEHILDNGYQFLHGLNGIIQYSPLSNAIDYDISKLEVLGRVKLFRGELLYLPINEEDKMVDLTTELISVEHHLDDSE